MKNFVKKMLWRAVLLIALAVVVAWGVIAYNAWRAYPLQAWHTYVPKEMSAAKIGSADWKAYVEHENQLFEDVKKNVTLALPPKQRVPMNRYYEEALVYPPALADDWNRSYIFYPEGEIKGAAVFLHGLTDTPYSLRHVARLYVQKGFVALAIRMPGHGTVPAGLIEAAWKDWAAATRLAVREARRIAGGDRALHLVGFSNGGALAVKYVMDALEDPSLPRPDRVVLLSPMIGITRFAKFAGLTAVPAALPAFANAAWLGVMPEFNPFKYNSFPVNGARQSYLLTRELQRQIERLSQTEEFATLPPILTFQSVLDFTVSTPAVFYRLYSYLPDNGSELVLYDVNHATLLGGLMRTQAAMSLQRMLPREPQRYTLSIVANRAPDDERTTLITRKAGEIEEIRTPLEYIYPKSVFSLSHGAVPFPMDDPLYGMYPSPEEAERYGVSLGSLLPRGERGALLVPMDAILRMSSNPFFPLLLKQVEKGIDDPRPPAGVPALLPPPSGHPVNIDEMYENFLENDDSEEYSGATIF